MPYSNLTASMYTTFLKAFNLISSTLLLTVVVLSISACGGKKDEVVQVEKETTKAEVPASTKASSGDIATEIQTNRDKWIAHDISDYQIEMQKICYCVPEVVRMMVFEVSEEKVASVRYADTGEDVDPQHYGNFNTIEGMFTFVEQALEKNPASLSITYHEEYGYIKELDIDFKENIADDEISIIASNMRPR